MPSVNAANPIVGIYVPTGITARLFFNTIYLNATSIGTNFGSSGIYYVNINTLDMRNNIVINVSKPNGNGITAAFRMSNNNLTSYEPSSNNNCFYAGPPRPNKLIFYDGTNR